MPDIDRRPPAIFLMGPTASGKTDLACALADRFPLDLISVDSALVYRGMDIGTAKPDAVTLQRYPHALVDIRDPAEPYSAADFRADAFEAMQRTIHRGRVPLLVGGTGLYFRALQHGLSVLPEADPAIRERLGQEAAASGWPALHVRLARLDPASAERISAHDTQRLQRALEVIEITGQPLSALIARARTHPLPFRVLKLALIPPDRARLHARIARRFDAMLQNGFLDEVRALAQRGDLSPQLPSMRAVGYRQALAFLGGEGDAAAFRDRGIFATRQLAKRQLTWLRREHDARTLRAGGDQLAGQACAALELRLRGAGVDDVARCRNS